MQKSGNNKPHPDCYRPSNSEEGNFFEIEFCNQCEREEAFWEKLIKEDVMDPDLACPIHNAGLAGYVSEWRYDEGKPTCTEFRRIEHG